MLSYISYFIQSSMLLILLHDYLQKNFPNQYNEFLINSSYNAIYCYSKFQLFYCNIKVDIYSLFTSNPHIKKIFDDIYNKKNERTIDIIQFYDRVLNIKKYSNDTVNHFEDKKGALYLFSDCINQQSNIIISRLQKFPQDYEISDTKFVLVELKLGEKKFKIDLRTENSNYYVVSNVLDKDFFLYYIFNHSHNFENRIESDELYSLIETGIVTILDDKVNSFEVDFKKNGSIVILNNGFTITHSSSELSN